MGTSSLDILRPTVRGEMAVILKGNSQGALSVSTSAAQTSAFSVAGYYDFWSDVDVYIKINTTANDVTSGTGYLLYANTLLANVAIQVGDKIGAIAGGAGTLRYHKVS